MTDRVEKQRVMDLLRRAGLWEDAQEYREAARQRLRAEGKTKQEAVAGAWREMADKYLPLAEMVDDPADDDPFQTILPENAESFDDFVDPGYKEDDEATRLRDAYRWIKDEFHRMVSDRAACTVVDYNRAKTPPPTGLACVILETWAAKSRQKRDGLFREIRIWLATGKLEPEPEPPMAEGEGGFLDEI